MKRVLLTFALLVSFLSMYAADNTIIIAAFKNGNATELTPHLDKELELIIPGVNKKCTSEETIKLLNGFFKKNKPSGFSVLHQAEKKENGFYVCKLTSSGTEYRATLTYKINNDTIILQSIRIE